MFNSFSKGYKPLSESDLEGKDLDTELILREVRARNRSIGFLFKSVFIALCASVVLNGYFYFSPHKISAGHIPKNLEEEDYVTRYAGLKREVPMAYAREGFENGIPDEEWNLWNPDLGTVALSYEYAKKMGLPEAEQYPWDLSKGIYFLHGHHTMHCLYKVRNSILQYRNGSLQTQHMWHIDHCLTQIRNDILCNADDTPRFTTGPDFHQAGSGTGQFRMCRDWHKLDMWAKAHTACYQTPSDPFFDGKKDYESFMHCYDGSTPWVGAKFWELTEEEQEQV